MIVVIEGMDFAGKSTVCRLVAEGLTRRGVAATQSTTSLTGGLMPKLISAVYQVEGLPPRLRSATYLACYLPDLIPTRRHGPDRVLVQESYIHRVLAYCRAREWPILAAAASVLTVRLTAQVDLAVLLTCPVEVRRDRYRASGAVNHRDDQRFGPQAAFAQRLDEELSALTRAKGYQVLSTADADAAAVAATLTDMIIGRLGESR